MNTHELIISLLNNKLYYDLERCVLYLICDHGRVSTETNAEDNTVLQLKMEYRWCFLVLEESMTFAGNQFPEKWIHVDRGQEISVVDTYSYFWATLVHQDIFCLPFIGFT